MNQHRGKRGSALRGIRTAGIVVLSFLFLAGCLNSNANPESYGGEATPGLKQVKVEKSSKQKIADPLERTAEVQASVQFNLLAEASGTIQEVMKNRGEFVQEGEVILTLHSQEIELQSQKAALAVQNVRNAMAKAKAKAAKDLANSQSEMDFSIRKMEEKVDEATKKYNKARNDYDDRMTTRAQLEQAEKDWKSVTLDLEELKHKRSTLSAEDPLSEMDKELRDAELTQAQADQASAALQIKAPISGLLTGEQPIQPGFAVQQGVQLGQIQKLDPILIKAHLPEEEAKLVRGKKELNYYRAETKTYVKGQISYFADIIDPQTKGYELILQVPNPDMNLKPGMKVQVQLTSADELVATTVPTYSVVKDGDDSYVFVLNGDTVEKRKVQLGRISEPYQEVLSGVKEGEEVVTSGQQSLVDKEKVERP